MSRTLEWYGVQHDYRVYRTTVRGRRYWRTKIIIRDTSITALLATWARRKRLFRSILERYKNVVLSVWRAMRIRTAILEHLPASLLREWLGIRPYNPMTYYDWRNRAVTRLLKPNWRGWLYMKRLMARIKEEAELMKDRW